MPFIRARVPDAARHVIQIRLPVRGYGAEQREQVGGAYDVDTAREAVGGESEPDERRVASIRAAVDRYPVRHGDLLPDRPVDGIQQIVVHVARPLVIACIDEPLAEAGRSPVVHRQHRVAAVREPLVLGVEAVAVAGPGPAVHIQHHRDGLRGPPRADLARACGKCQIGDQSEPVARADLNRLHRPQRCAHELRPVLEQLRHFAARALVQVARRDVSRIVDDHDPLAVIECATRHLELRSESCRQALDVLGRRLRERRELGSQVLHAVGLWPARPRVEPDLRHVGLVALADDGLLAALELDAHERRLVPVDRAHHEGGAIAFLDHEGSRREAVGRTVAQEAFPAPLGAPVELPAAVGQSLHRELRAQLQVLHIAGEFLIVALDELALAARDVDLIQIVPFCRAIVERDQRHVGPLVRQANDLRLYFAQRRQVALRAGLDIHAVDAPVLVAALILEKQHVAGVFRPQMLADAALAIVGDRLCGLQRSGLRQPHIHHTVPGRKEGEITAVRAQARLRAHRVAEQRGARDQRTGVTRGDRDHSFTQKQPQHEANPGGTHG